MVLSKTHVVYHVHVARQLLGTHIRLVDKKATLQELAAKYGVSAERIRQLEAVALKKLKTQMVA